MPQLSKDNEILGSRYALCVGIGTYTNLSNFRLSYAVDDATIIAKRLADPQRGNFTVTLLTEPNSTCKAALDKAMEELLSAPDRQAEDLIVVYFSSHGTVSALDNTFCLLPSDAALQAEGTPEQATLIGISDFARWLYGARAQNIVILLDVCHSGGAGAALQLFKMNLDKGPNYFIIGRARQDQVARGSSRLEHGFFTHCLLRAFEQPPTKDGWLTISQVHNFVSDEIPWYYKGQPIQIQGLSVSVNPNLPLLRNPCYPELSPLPPFWNVPLQRNPFFTGQENLLSQLASGLQREQKTVLTQPQAINGLGGIGKTQLALEYAYRHRQDYHAILWGNADTREKLIDTFVTIASLLDLPQKDEKDQMVIVEAVKAWLADRTGWLLILDNANELALVDELIPPAFRGHLLLTTRTQVLGALARQFKVQVMQPEIGALLLLRRSKLLAPEMTLEQASPTVIKLAQELARELGGLPLALDQAAAYIDEAQCGLERYLQLYRTRRTLLLQRRGELADHPDSVATTLSLSLEKAALRSPVTVNIMRLCAFLSPDAIPEELFTIRAVGPELILAPVAADELELDDAIVALRAYSLVSRDWDTHTLTVHRLVQAVVGDALSVETRQQWKKQAVLAVSAACPNVEDVSKWNVCEQWLPHALVCATWIEQEAMTLPEAALLLNEAGYYLDGRARYAEAEPLYEQALRIWEQQLGPNHPQVTVSLNNLAELYKKQGKLIKAEPLFVHVLSIREQQLGPEHPDTAQSLNNLALLYRVQGKYAEVEPLYLRALVIYEQQLGPEHPDVAKSLNNLAELYYEQDKYAEAEPLYLRALAIYEQQLGPEHPDTAQSLNNLAVLYHKQGKHAEVESLYLRALAVREQQLGPEHPDVANSLNNLAGLYYEQGKYAEAEPLYLRALAIYEQQLGPEHPDTANSLNNLALLYHKQSKHAEVESLYLRAFAIREQQLGPEHPTTAQSLNNLADFYWGQGKHAEAEPLLQRVLANNVRQLGSEHLLTATSLNNLAESYRVQGKYAEAEPLYLRALVIYEQQLGLEHFNTAASLNNLALLYHEQGKYAEAESLYLHALAIFEQQPGPEHPITAQSINNLADFYCEQGKYAEAELLYLRALAIREQQLGPEHPDVANSLNNLAESYRVQGKYAEAEPLYLRAFAIREQQLGAAHPRTATSLNNLALLYHEQGKYAEAEPLYLRALTIFEQQLGPEHPRTQTVRDNSISLQRMMGR